MKLVFYEIKKVLSKRIFWGILAFCFVINLCTFYFANNDYRAQAHLNYNQKYAEMLRKYGNMSPEKAVKKLRNKQEAFSIYQMMNEMINSDSDYSEVVKQLLEEQKNKSPKAYAVAEKMFKDPNYYEYEIYFTNIVLSQLEHNESYSDFVGAIKENAQEQTSFSVFADKNSFSYKNIIKTADDYKGLENIKLSIGNDFSLTSALKYSVTDYFLVAIALFVCVYLFRYERDKGLYNLVRSSRHGKLKTISAKLVAMTTIVFLFSAIFIFSIFAESTIMFGQWDLFRPIQSVQGFDNCILTLSCEEFCLLFTAVKIFGVILTAAIFTFVFVLCSGVFSTFGFSLGFMLLEIISYNAVAPDSAMNYLKYINIFYILNSSDLLGNYINLNIFGNPIQASSVAAAIFISAFIILIGTSVLVFVLKTPQKRTSTILSRFSRFKEKHSKIKGSSAIISGEFYKYLVSSKVAFIMIVLLIFAIASSMSLVQYRITDKSVIAYRNYITTLSGELTRDKEEYISKQEKYFKSIEKKLNNLSTDKSLSNEEKKALTRQYDIILETQGQGFNMVKEQYNRLFNLRENGLENVWLVDEIVYTDFISNPSREWNTLIFNTILLLITIPFIFTFEYRNKMIDLLQSTKGGRLRLYKAKLLTAICSTMFTFGIAYIPYIIRFVNTFGKLNLEAPLVCVSAFEQSGFNISLGNVFLMLTFIYLLIAILSALIIVAISTIIKNHLLSVIFSGVILLVPCIVINNFSTIRIGEIFKGNSVLLICIISSVCILGIGACLFISVTKFVKLDYKNKLKQEEV